MRVKKLALGGLVGGLLFFVWTGISWTFLAWHTTTLHPFQNEELVKQTIAVNTLKSGTYFLPTQKPEVEAEPNQTIKAPVVFAVVQLEDPQPMNCLMGTSLLLAIIAALVMTWISSQLGQASYLKRLFTLVMVALSGCITIHLTYWNWFGFPLNYTLVMIADELIGWFLAGLVIAKVSMPKK